jgi:hypothetical protein
MTAQLELRLKEPKRRFDQSHVDEMIRQLKAGATKENRGWLTAADLGAKTWSEKRDVRAIARISKGGIVSWPGSPGYKPTEDCTLEEVQHCRKARRSLAREILVTLRQIERVAHATLAGKEPVT